MSGILRSINESATRLGVSPFTVRRLVKAGRLKAVRVGRRVLVSDTEIGRVMEEGCPVAQEPRANQ
jgi:excisionase family DNA binding protein